MATARQMPNFAWSSQARGFFTDRAGRDKRDNEELVRVWYSEQNFGRRDRAIELAKKLGKSPIHVALAYVLAQPFPSVPLIGPRTLDELDDSLKALDIKLSPADVDWLEGGEERVRGRWRELRRRRVYAPPSSCRNISPAGGRSAAVWVSPIFDVAELARRK